MLSKPFSDAELAAAVPERLGRLPPARATRTSAERLLARLRDPTLRNLFLAWCDARLGGGLPRSGSVSPVEFGVGDHAFTVEVDNSRAPPAMRFIMLGPALAARLGRTLEGQFTASEYGGDDVLGALDTAYNRCARLLLPVHQSARYDFGDDAPVSFERLVLPFSEDGLAVTHLVGVALFEGETTLPARSGCHDI